MENGVREGNCSSFSLCQLSKCDWNFVFHACDESRAIYVMLCITTPTRNVLTQQWMTISFLYLHNITEYTLLEGHKYFDKMWDSKSSQRCYWTFLSRLGNDVVQLGKQYQTFPKVVGSSSPRIVILLCSTLKMTSLRSFETSDTTQWHRYISRNLNFHFEFSETNMRDTTLKRRWIKNVFNAEHNFLRDIYRINN